MNELLYQTLIDHLKTVDGLYPLVTENQVIQTKTIQPFAQAHMIWADEPTQVSIGLGGKDMFTGILRVNLHVPVNTGTNDVNDLADRIIAAFPRGTTFPVGENFVHVTKAYRSSANRLNENFHTVPVSLRWSLIFTNSPK